MKTSMLNFGQLIGTEHCHWVVIALYSVPLMVMLFFREILGGNHGIFHTVTFLFSACFIIFYAIRIYIADEIAAKAKLKYNDDFLVSKKCYNVSDIIFNFSIWSFNGLDSQLEEEYILWILENKT